MSKGSSDSKKAFVIRHLGLSISAKTAVSFVFSIALMAIAAMKTFGIYLPFAENYPAVEAVIEILLFLPIAYVGREIYRDGLAALIRLKPNTKTVAAVGTSVAVIFSLYSAIRTFLGHSGYLELICFEPCGVIISMVLLGCALEEKSAKKAGEPAKKLGELFPKTAAVIIDDVETVSDIGDIAVGDCVLIKPCESVPCDGVIMAGKADVCEAMLTGENSAVIKSVGERVYAGTYNFSGTATIKAERVGEDTALARMIRSVVSFSGSKPKAAPFGRRIEIVFSWVVLAIGLAAFIAWIAFYKNTEISIRVLLGMLTVSCPCALGLATPAAAAFVSGKCAKEGILFKDADAMEKMGIINTAVMDKTGTVTVGKPFVTDVVPFGVSAEEVVMLAASLETDSTHPIALALLDYASKNDIYPQSCHQLLIAEGEVGGRVDDADIKVASAETLLSGAYEGYMSFCKNLSESGKDIIAVAKDGIPIGIIAFSDRLKPTSKTAVARLESLGIRSIMLTGDSEEEAKRVAEQAGFYDFAYEVSPDKKGAFVAGLKKSGRRVAMVGDSVNDAVALAAADIGVAIGTGSAIAIDSAEVVLLRNDLRDIAKAVRISRAARKIIRENIFWAVIYNLIALPFAAGIFFALTGRPLNPAVAIGCMLLSTVSVLLNSRRINKLDLTREDDLADKVRKRCHKN